MKDEVAPTEETRPQVPAISLGLPDGGWTDRGRRKGREVENHDHRRLMPEQPTGTRVHPVCDSVSAKSVPLEDFSARVRHFPMILSLPRLRFGTNPGLPPIFR